jgi:glycosyltransferase involved in cell wall biosynthesis
MNRHQTAERKSVRPVLIISKRTVLLYSSLLERLLVGLASESIPVALVCPSNYDVDSIAHGTVEVIRQPTVDLPPMTWLNIKKLTQYLTAFKPTILHCLCESKSSLTKQLSNLLDLPYLLTVNSIRHRWQQLHISPKYCAIIIVPAKSIAVSIAAAYPKFADRLEQINAGTFVEESAGCFTDTRRLPSVIAVAHPGNENQFENLLAAVKSLVDEDYQLMLFITATGHTETVLRKSITKRGLSQTVIIIPELKPWRVLLTAADVFIQPAPSNDFNLLLLEAMSLGTAVAACKGGVDDFIIEGRTAVVFDPNDEHSIKKTIQQLLDKPKLARSLAASAQQYLKENHTVTAMVSSILRVYSEAPIRLSSVVCRRSSGG